MNKTIILLNICSIALTSCIIKQVPALDKLKNIPAKKLESHSANLNKKFTDRIVPAPPAVLDFLNKMDSTDKYIQYHPSDPEKKMFSGYYELLPPKYKSIIEKKVIAVYFIKNFIGGGMSDFVFDNSGTMYIALYFNPEILHMTLSDWTTYRDNSTFADDGNKITITSVCGKGRTGLLHTLVHEASHIYDYFYHTTPFVEPVLMEKDLRQISSEFTGGIWKEYSHPVEKHDFPRRTAVSVYGLGKKLPRALSIDLYKSLNKSPFSSLYGTSNWAEDFAETFTWYYLNNKLGIKYAVKIIKEGKECVIFSPLDNELVKNRHILLQSLVK